MSAHRARSRAACPVRVASPAVPVLVTAAHRPLERRLVLRLLEEGGDVRAYSDGDTSVLRAAGAFVASGTPDDEGRLDAACTDVHTVVHLGADLLAAPDDLVRDVEVLLRAVTGAGVRRVIALSLPGAAQDAADPVRRALGEVELRLARADVPTVVLRTSLVATPDLVDTLATAGLPRASFDREIAPVRLDDLLELITAFDRARSRASSGHLVVAADGPERLTIDALLRRAGASPPGRGGLVGRTLAPPDRAEDLEAVLAGPWWTQDPLVVDGWRFAGITPRAVAGAAASAADLAPTDPGPAGGPDR